MRVYNFKDFLKLPPGTIFSQGEKWFFEGFFVKTDSLENDFYSINLCNIDSFDSAQWSDRLEDSLNNGTSYPINYSECRDASYRDDLIFLVFEKDDLQKLIIMMSSEDG